MRNARLGNVGLVALVALAVVMALPGTGSDRDRGVDVAGAEAPAAEFSSQVASPVLQAGARAEQVTSGRELRAERVSRTTVRAAAVTGAGRIRYGKTYSGRATFYQEANGGGNCMYPEGGDMMIGAMNMKDFDKSRACGAILAVTSRGRTIKIKIVDSCPECPTGAIDLSPKAFSKLAPKVKGIIPITWKLLSPPMATKMSYVYKKGSTKYWCALQVRNHRNPVNAVELRDGGRWKRLARTTYNFFESTSGSGCGGPVRVTDIYGNQVVDSGFAVKAGAVVTGRGQFRGPA